MTNPMDVLTPEQREALSAFQQQHGRQWRSVLLAGWQRAAYPGPLQQIRNQFGPVWLASVKTLHKK